MPMETDTQSLIEVPDLDLCQWKRKVQKIFFEYIALKNSRNFSRTAAVGKKEKNVWFFLFFPPTAAGGAICVFLVANCQPHYYGQWTQ